MSGARTQGEQGQPATNGAAPHAPDTELIPSAGHATLARVRALIDLPSVKVLSTDVFDTIVWRRVIDPVLAFPLVGARLADEGLLARGVDASSFAQMRRVAEQRVRARRLEEAGESEITLAEVYERIPSWAFRDGTLRTRLIHTELEVERELLVPDLDVVELLIHAHEQGKEVVAVSDTYFTSEHLRFLLGQPILSALTFRHVFASCDHRQNKSGDLFDVMLSTVGVKAEEVVHIGDHPIADVEHAKSRGMHSVLLRRRAPELDHLLALEGRLGAPDVGLTALRAKMEHRAELAEMPPALKPYWLFGATVFGPAFAGFADWVHLRAQELGAEKILCLRREGSFLGELISAAAPHMESGVTAEILWLNRDLCQRAAIGGATKEEIEPLCDRRTPPTIERLCRTLGISVTDLPAFVGHADTRLEDPITRELFLDAIESTPRVQEKVRLASRELRERVVSYVEQQAGDKGPVVLVDLGWGASIQRRLAEAYEQAGVERHIAGLYMVTHEGAVSGLTENVEISGFLASLGKPADVVDAVMRSPEVLEQVCMPDHGTQTGLTADFQPELEHGDRVNLQRVEAGAVRQGIRAFCREWARYSSALPGKLTRLAEAPAGVAPLIVRSIVTPTEEEVGLFGDWYHDENQGSDRSDALIDMGMIDTVRHVAPGQLAELPMREVYWPAGLALRADPDAAQLTEAAATGAITWDATASTVETGRFRIRASRGVGIEGLTGYETRLRRNRLGLSFVSAQIKSSAIEEVELRPAEQPCVIRLDWITLRLWVQGSDDPVVVRLDAPSGFAQLEIEDGFLLSPNVLVVSGNQPAIRFDMARATNRVVFRADIECALAVLPASIVLPGEGSVRNLGEAAARLADVEALRSVKILRKLRGLKRRLTR